MWALNSCHKYKRNEVTMLDSRNKTYTGYAFESYKSATQIAHFKPSTLQVRTCQVFLFCFFGTSEVLIKLEQNKSQPHNGSQDYKNKTHGTQSNICLMLRLSLIKNSLIDKGLLVRIFKFSSCSSPSRARWSAHSLAFLQMWTCQVFVCLENLPMR